MGWLILLLNLVCVVIGVRESRRANRLLAELDGQLADRKVLFAVLAAVQRATRRGDRLGRNWQHCVIDYARKRLPWANAIHWSMWDDERKRAAEDLLSHARRSKFPGENEGLPHNPET